jgi:hypothetical protein
VTFTRAYEYCHGCDNGIAEGDANVIEEFAVDVMYRDAGESGVLCDQCYADYPDKHEAATLVGGKIPAHNPGAYPTLSCCGGTTLLVRVESLAGV